MKTSELIRIVKTRIAAEEKNATGTSVLYEIVRQLERLEKYENEKEDKR